MNFEVYADEVEFARVFPTKGQLNLKVLTLVSEDLFVSLQPSCHAIKLPESQWCHVVDTLQPDFFLIESSTEKHVIDWLTGKPAEDFNKFLKKCRACSIPVVFWHTSDVSRVELFESIVAEADVVGCVSEPVLDKYKSLGVKTVVSLPLAVQPAIFNPFVQPHQVSREGGQVLFDSWSDLIEFPDSNAELLRQFVGDGLRIVDPNWLYMSNKLVDSPELSECVLGKVDLLQLAQLYKTSNLLILSGDSLLSEESRTQRLINGLSSGCAVFSPGKIVSDFSLAEMTLDIDQLSSGDGRLATASLNKFAHRARRTLWSKHTYMHRLESLCNLLNLDVDFPSLPKIEVVTPTKRPHLITECLARFEAFDYPDKHMTIVLNTASEHVVKDAKNILSGAKDVSLLVVHEELNIGTCLNLAIQKTPADVWLKVDDDDFYGPNYILDFALVYHCLAADSVAKAPAYTYFQALDQTHILKGGRFANSVAGEKGHFCGATLSGTREVNSKIPFSMERRANVDANFVKALKSSGMLTLFLDNYNFSIFRGGDKNAHTWRVSDESIKKQADFSHEGVGLNSIYV